MNADSECDDHRGRSDNRSVDYFRFDLAGRCVVRLAFLLSGPHRRSAPGPILCPQKEKMFFVEFCKVNGVHNRSSRDKMVL